MWLWGFVAACVLLTASSAQADTILTYTLVTPDPYANGNGAIVEVDNSLTGTFSVDTTTNSIAASDLSAIVDVSDNSGNVAGYSVITSGSFTFTEQGTFSSSTAQIVDGDNTVSIESFGPWQVGALLQVSFSIPVTDQTISTNPNVPNGSYSRQGGSSVTDEITEVDTSVSETPIPNSFSLFFTALMAAAILRKVSGISLRGAIIIPAVLSTFFDSPTVPISTVSWGVTSTVEDQVTEVDSTVGATPLPSSLILFISALAICSYAAPRSRNSGSVAIQSRRGAVGVV